jgi:hypothetical protein
VFRIPSRRSWVEWRLLGSASVTMAAFAVAIKVLPATMGRYAGVQPRVRRLSSPRQPASMDQIVRAVNGASCIVPGGGNCLVRAMTARALLARQGRLSELVLGVVKQPSGTLGGHAWLQCEGATVVGQNGAAEYVPMPTAPSRRYSG